MTATLEKRILTGTFIAGSTLFLVACSVSVSSTPTVPDYTVVTPRQRTIVVEVDRLPTKMGLRAIFDDIVADHSDEEGGQSVLINCSSGATESVDNRLANGRFAIGGLGEAETGLPAGGTEFSVQPNTACPR